MRAGPIEIFADSSIRSTSSHEVAMTHDPAVCISGGHDSSVEVPPSSSTTSGGAAQFETAVFVNFNVGNIDRSVQQTLTVETNDLARDACHASQSQVGRQPPLADYKFIQPGTWSLVGSTVCHSRLMSVGAGRLHLKSIAERDFVEHPTRSKSFVFDGDLQHGLISQHALLSWLSFSGCRIRRGVVVMSPDCSSCWACCLPDLRM